MRAVTGTAFEHSSSSCPRVFVDSRPGQQEMDAFLSKAASLDPNKVAEALARVHGAVDWRARSKALAVVEVSERVGCFPEFIWDDS